jgi:hypothetical protein
MSTNGIVPFDDLKNSLPDFYDQFDSADLDALGAGIGASYAVLSIRGKVWRVKWQGEEHVLRDTKGEPLRSFPGIIVGVSPAISKTYYEGAYESGSNDSPDCASSDGIRPDNGVPNPQNPLCATCPNNVFGSRVLDNGAKAKACADYKRLAVVPASDIENARFGGPMLLRIPPASLQGLIAFMGLLKQYRCPPYACITAISFDVEAEFPKLQLKPVGAITDQALMQRVLEVKGSAVIDTLLNGFGSTGTDALPSFNPKQAISGPAAQPARKATNGAAKPAAKPAPVAPQVEEAQLADEGQAEEGDDDNRSLLPEGAGDLLADLNATSEPEPPAAPKPARKAAPKPAPAAAPVASAQVENALSDLLAGLQ